jgi:hypothetical protein
MEPKPAQSNGWMHGTVTSIATHRGHRTYYNFIAKLDDGRHFVLKQSYAPPPDARVAAPAYTPAFQHSFSSFGYRRSSDPEPLEIGSHVMVEPSCCERDTRVKYPVAGMWRRAKKDEIPAAPPAAPAFQEREPLPEPPAQIDVPAVRTTPFSKTSKLAEAIQRDLSAARMGPAKAFILYDPVDSSAYMPFLCFARTEDDLQWAVDTINQLGGADVGYVRSTGQNGIAFTDHMGRSSFNQCMDGTAGSMAVIPLPGLSRKGQWGAEIECEIENFCVHSAQLGI